MATLNTLNIVPMYASINIELLFNNEPIPGTFGTLRGFPQLISLTGAAGVGATLLNVSALPMAVRSGTRIQFKYDSGTTHVARNVITTADAPAGSTSIFVQPLAFSMAMGSLAYVTGVRYRQAGATTWNLAMPLWPTFYRPTKAVADLQGEELAVHLLEEARGHACYLKLVPLTEETTYQFQIVDLPGMTSISDPNSFMYPTTHQATTRKSIHLTPSALFAAAHYYVDAVSGSDSNPGTFAQPFQTLSRAYTAATDGTILGFKPGRYAWPNIVLTKQVQLVAQYPAMNETFEPINFGLHSIIEHNNGSTGTITAPDSGVWVQVPTFNGPTTGQPISTMWKWTGGGTGYGATPGNNPDTNRLFYGPERDPSSVETEPQRFGFWETKSGAITPSTGPWAGKTFRQDTPQYWADIIMHAYHTRVAWTRYASDLYAFFPPGMTNPNAYWWFWSESRGTDFGSIWMNGSNQRVCGFAIRSIDILLGASAFDCIVDHNYCYAWSGIGAMGAKHNTFGSHHLIEYNEVSDSSTYRWPIDTDWPVIPWNTIKGGIRLAPAPAEDNSWSRHMAQAEAGGIGGTGGAMFTTWRHNRVRGFFNGWGAYNVGFTRYAHYMTDIQNCEIVECADDAFEPENVQCGMAIWNCRTRNNAVIWSVAPVKWGPLYFFDNDVTINNNGAGYDEAGTRAVAGLMLKYASNSIPEALVALVNNTVIDYQGHTLSGGDGGGHYGGGGDRTSPFWLRNNIVLMGRYAMQRPPITTQPYWDDDYNFMATKTTSFQGINTFQSITSYRGTGQGAHDNVTSDGASHNITADDVILAAITGPTTYDHSLQDVTQSVIDMGIPIPMLSDTWSRNAPDLGYSEYTLVPVPATPTGLTATTVDLDTINLDWTDVATDEDGYEVWRSLDGVTWEFVADVAAGTIDYDVDGLTPDTGYQFRVRAYKGVT